MTLENNMLSGGIPSELGGISVLKELELEENTLEGTMPIEICQAHEFWRKLEADCGGQSPKVSCACCTCCERCDA
jgi:hypothetical protein